MIEPEEVFNKTGYSRPHTVHCGPEGIYVSTLGGGPSLRVLPRKMRALSCFITCLTRGTMTSSWWRILFKHQLLQDVRRPLHAVGDLLGKPLRLSDYSAGRVEQSAVSALEPRLALRALGARRPRDIEHPQFHAATCGRAVGSSLTRDLADLLHGADQHPHPVAQQARLVG